jgi:hypothetical protein
MQRALLVVVSLALSAGNARGCPFPHYNVGSDCCNIFGGNCAGPCWNRGCLTTCDRGKYGDGFKVSCPGSDGYYNCCPNGSMCKPQCEAQTGGCCCTDELVEIISMDQITYDWDRQSSAPDASSTRVTLVSEGLNAGPTDASAPSLTTSVSNSQSSSWSVESTTKLSVEATITAGVPFFDGTLKIGAEQTFAYTTTRTSTNTVAVTIETGQDTIPPMSRKVWEFAAGMRVVSVPFTAQAVATTDCGGTRTTQVEGLMRLSGIASFVKGRYTKLVGPTVPIECESPFGLPVAGQINTPFCPSAPSEQCADNVLCLRAGLVSGKCCGARRMKGCCARAKAHPLCKKKYPAGSVICPSATGFFDACCFATSPGGKRMVPRHGNASASFHLHLRLDSSNNEPATSTAPGPTRVIKTPPPTRAVPLFIERVVALNMTQDRRRPSVQ